MQTNNAGYFLDCRTAQRNYTYNTATNRLLHSGGGRKFGVRAGRRAGRSGKIHSMASASGRPPKNAPTFFATSHCAHLWARAGMSVLSNRAGRAFTMIA